MSDPFDTPVTRDAATLIVLRDRVSGAPEILMVQRAATMAFAAGALVFPGGVIDADDYVLARDLQADLPVEEMASRICAIRETLEESGIAPGLGTSDPDVLAHIRRELKHGVSFSSLVQEQELSIGFEALIPFARWHPSAVETVRRVFDARFYLARYDPQGPEPTVDETENVHLFWDTAQGVLERCMSGLSHVIFPTRRNLERLAQFSTIGEIERHACAFPVEKVVPWIEERPDGRHLCIPDHLGYPICSEPLEAALRS